MLPTGSPKAVRMGADMTNRKGRNVSANRRSALMQVIFRSVRAYTGERKWLAGRESTCGPWQARGLLHFRPVLVLSGCRRGNREHPLLSGPASGF